MSLLLIKSKNDYLGNFSIFVYFPITPRSVLKVAQGLNVSLEENIQVTLIVIKFLNLLHFRSLVFEKWFNFFFKLTPTRDLCVAAGIWPLEFLEPAHPVTFGHTSRKSSKTITTLADPACCTNVRYILSDITLSNSSLS
jgi:hypothetical protein